MHASSVSNTRAGPVWRRRSVPASLTTLPSGARLPRSACSAPLGLNGCSRVRTTSPSGASRPPSPLRASGRRPWAPSRRRARRAPARGSAPRCRRPGGSPRPSQRPEGARLASTGVRLATRGEVGERERRPASRAMASRCRTPFVEPPLPATPAIALSSAPRSRKRAGHPLPSSRTASAPAGAAASSLVLRSSAGISRRRCGARPRQSATPAMVLAVYWAAQVPGPGHACARSSTSAWSSRPRALGRGPPRCPGS